MVHLHTMIEQVGRFSAQNPFSWSHTLLEKANSIAIDPPDVFELLVLRNSRTEASLPVFNIEKKSQLLVWCPSMEAIIDIAKIRPIKKEMLKCHQVMLDYQKSQKRNILDQFWPDELIKLGTGNFDKLNISGILEMVVEIATGSSIETIIFNELIASFPGAIQAPK